MGKHNDFGKEGEQIAVDFLLKKDYIICARNYRHLKAEVDIIAKKEGILAIIEVKTRTKGFMEDLSKVVNKKKITLLTSAADQYVIENNLDVEVRFDLITLIKRNGGFDLEHLKNAYYFF